MMLLLSNWKIIATVILCWMLHMLVVNSIDTKHAAQITSIKAAMTVTCNNAQEKTRKISHDYQIQLSSLNSRLSSAHGLHDNHCVAITIDSAGGYHAAATGKELSGRNVRADRLLDIAGRAEKVRLQLKACQSFLKEENNG